MTLGAIEAGGTKWICALGTEAGELIDVQVIPTGPPAKTLAAAQLFFHERELPSALGIASFGPLELDPDSPLSGQITTTAKPGWSYTDIVTPFSEGLGVPVALDSDVNAAALAECRRGAGQGLQNVVYITVGTGIGAGFVVDSKVLRGNGHPEFGHTRVLHDDAADPFAGSCPYHGDCLEGLASGEAMRRRWGHPSEEIETPAAWQLEAHYLALAVTNLIYTIAPQRIVLGGGVMAHPQLLEMVREDAAGLLAGYAVQPGAGHDLTRLIVSPALAPLAGLHGGLELARDLHTRMNGNVGVSA